MKAHDSNQSTTRRPARRSPIETEDALVAALHQLVTEHGDEAVLPLCAALIDTETTAARWLADGGSIPCALLSAAAAKGSSFTIDMALNHLGCDLDSPAPRGLTEIATKAETKATITSGTCPGTHASDVEFRTWQLQGMTALQIACKNGQKSVVKDLLRLKADPDDGGSSQSRRFGAGGTVEEGGGGWRTGIIGKCLTPLQLAAIAGRAEVVEVLLGKQASPTFTGFVTPGAVANAIVNSKPQHLAQRGAHAALGKRILKSSTEFPFGAPRRFLEQTCVVSAFWSRLAQFWWSGSEGDFAGDERLSELIRGALFHTVPSLVCTMLRAHSAIIVAVVMWLYFQLMPKLDWLKAADFERAAKRSMTFVGIQMSSIGWCVILISPCLSSEITAASLFGFTVLLCLMLSCYWYCILTKPPGATGGMAPRSGTADELEERKQIAASSLDAFVEMVGTGAIVPPHKGGRPIEGSLCSHCHQLREDRSHHCHQCGVCVAKLDHHCPGIANCVWSGNRFAFVAFLVLIFGCQVTWLSWAYYAMDTWSSYFAAEPATCPRAVFVQSAMQANCAVGFFFLAWNQILFISINMTTVEWIKWKAYGFSGQCGNPHNKGIISNWLEVCPCCSTVAGTHDYELVPAAS